MSVWVLLMRPQKRRLLAAASVICGLIIAQAAWLNFPPLSGLRILRKHTHSHSSLLHSQYSLSRSLLHAFSRCVSQCSGLGSVFTALSEPHDLSDL